jgi:DNA-binding response OmpR family regulator
LRLLLVEDHPDLSEVLRKALAEEGYAVDVSRDGTEGLWRATTVDYDLLVLDILLPGVDGLQILGKVRAAGRKVPVLLLTARDSLADRVRGLDAGADDYIVKPFELAELFARVRALLRRRPTGSSGVLRHRDLELDPARHAARRGARTLDLSPREFAILELLLRDPERVFSRTEITGHTYDDSSDAMSNVVDVFIGRLRRKVNAEGEAPLIRTVRGVGYALGGGEPA